MCKKKKYRILLSVIHVTLVQAMKKKKKRRQCEKHHTMTGLNKKMKCKKLVQALVVENLY